MAYLERRYEKGMDYYRICESYRENGKPRKRVLYNIGNFDALKKFVVHSLNADVESVDCKEMGLSWVCWHLACVLKMPEIMDRDDAKQTREDLSWGTALTLAAIHRVCAAGSRFSFSDWAKKTILPSMLSFDPDQLNSRHFWEQMDDVTGEKAADVKSSVVDGAGETPSEKPGRKAADSDESANNETDVQLVEDRIAHVESEIAQSIKDHFHMPDDAFHDLDFCNIFMFDAPSNACNPIFQRNRQGRKDPRPFSIALMTNRHWRIPLRSLVDLGKHPDTQAFAEYLDFLKKHLGDEELSHVTLVFDGDRVGERNLQLIPGHFITRLSISQAKAFYDIPREQYREILLHGAKHAVYRSSMKRDGKRLSVLLTLSEDLKNSQLAQLEREISRLEENISALNCQLQNPRSHLNRCLCAIKESVDQWLTEESHLKEFVEVRYDICQKNVPVGKKSRTKKETSGAQESTDSKDGAVQPEENTSTQYIVTKVSVTVNEDKMKRVMDHSFGKQLILSDRMDLSATELLSAYADQEYVESLFRDLKNPAQGSMLPVYDWTDNWTDNWIDDRIRMQIHLCVLALMLSRCLHQIIAQNGLHDSEQAMLDHLSQIRLAYVVFASQAKEETLCHVQKKMVDMNDDEKAIWKTMCSHFENLESQVTESCESVS